MFNENVICQNVCEIGNLKSFVVHVAITSICHRAYRRFIKRETRQVERLWLTLQFGRRSTFHQQHRVLSCLKQFTAKLLATLTNKCCDKHQFYLHASNYICRQSLKMPYFGSYTMSKCNACRLENSPDQNYGSLLNILHCVII